MSRQNRTLNLYRTERHRTILSLFAASTFLLSVCPAFAQSEPVIERRIVISLEERKVALLENGQVVKIYPVAVGKPRTPSPVGTYKVINRMKNPTWYGPKQVVSPGPHNPLGTRWMGLSKAGYGIHGTNAPSSIGKSASHGCIRMRKADVEELFELVQVGDTVELRAGHDTEIAQWFGTAEKERAKVPVAVD